ARVVPVGRPLPNVAGHVVDLVTIRGEATHGRERTIAVAAFVGGREVALPSVGAELALRVELVAPGVFRAFEPSASGVLELGFGWQPLPLRGAVGGGVVPRDVNDGVIVAAFYRRAGALGMPPV